MAHPQPRVHQTPRRLTRRSVLGGAAGTAALTLSACVTSEDVSSSSDDGGAAEPVPGGVLLYGSRDEPGNGGLDPFSTAVYASTAVLALVYDTLLTKNVETKEIEPLLAESWEVDDDATTYGFVLREGAKFADGTTVTVDDVAFSFQQVKDSTLSTKSYLADLKDLTTDADARSVTFTFSEPNPAFLNIVSDRKNYFVVSKEWYEATSDQDRQKTANGSGPFTLDHWTQGTEVALVKNPHYWDQPKPYLDGITFRVVPDESTILSQIQSGQLHAGWLWNSTLAQQGEESGLRLGTLQNTSTRVLYLNADSVFEDVRVRQAFSRAVDREKLAEVGAKGFGEISFITEPTQKGVAAPQADTPNYARDVEGAKTLLAEAGVDAPTVSLVYQSESNDRATWELLKEQVAEAGFTIDLQPVEYSRIQEVFTSGAPFFSDLLAVQNVGRPDIAGDFNQWVPKESNLSTWGDDEQADHLRELFEQLVAEPDQDARIEVADQLNQEIAEQAFIMVPYATPLSYSLSTSAVHGYDPDPFDSRITLASTWIDQ